MSRRLPSRLRMRLRPPRDKDWSRKVTTPLSTSLCFGEDPAGASFDTRQGRLILPTTIRLRLKKQRDTGFAKGR